MRRSAVFLFAALAAGAVTAAPYKVLPGSTLGFSATYEGDAFAGSFKRFTPVIDFDPAKLATSKMDVSIELASADTQNTERDDALHGVGFFNSKRMPKARYVATRFRALGGNRYAADGALTLNGITKPVVLAFTWSGGAKPVLTGNATLKRLEFQVGSGEWSDTDVIGDAVQVKTRLLLSR